MTFKDAQEKPFSTLEEACLAVEVLPPPFLRPLKSGLNSVRAKDDAHGKFSGRVRVFDDGRGYLVMNNRNGLKALVILGYKEGGHVDREAIERAHAEAAANKLKTDKAEKAQFERAARLARKIWATAVPCSRENPHPYLLKKGVPFGFQWLRELPRAKLQGLISENPPTKSPQLLSESLGTRVLIIPLESAMNVRSLQFVGEDGAAKTFLKGGKMSGSVWCGSVPDDAAEIGVAEGVATALSVQKVSEIPCAAAMNCGNLESGVKTLLKKFPRARFHLFADSDKPAKGEVLGIGEKKARAAFESLPAVENRGAVFVPEFTADDRAAYRRMTGKDDKAPSDFNDLYLVRGLL